MEFKKKSPTSPALLARALTPALVTPVIPTLERLEAARPSLQTHLSRPVKLQRQIVQPALSAATLHTQEVQRLDVQRQALQSEAAELGPVTPQMLDQVLQRQQAPVPIPPLRPQGVGDWVTVMRAQAEQNEGRVLSSREAAQYSALQRQVAQTIAQGFRQDRQPAGVRHGQYGGHLAALHQTPGAGSVAAAALRLMPGGERPAVQRALDSALQRAAEQQAQEARALTLHTLQRQMAELDAQSMTPVHERINARRGSGNPLPALVQRHLEQGLNHDLSRVRIHDDAEADKLAKGVNALAFTTGSDIYFRSGRFNPNTQSGLELLAHEVTHTVQQSRGRVGRGVDPDAGLESEARAMGRRLASAPVRLSRSASRGRSGLAPLTVGHAVQRQVEGGGGLIEKLVQAINSGKIEEALKVIRGVPKDKQAKLLSEAVQRFSGKIGPQIAEGLQAMIDGLSSRVPDAIKRVAKQAVDPGKWQPPGKQPIPYYIGTSAHNAIAQHYADVHAGEQVFTNTRPMSTILGRAARTLSTAEQLLKPDIVNLDKRHLYEIKSRTQAALAVAEAAMYLGLFRKANVKMELGPVGDPGVIGVLPAPGGHYAFQAIAPGAIVYDYRKGRYDPQAAPAPAPVPVPAPAPVQDRQQRPAPQPVPTTDPDFIDRVSKATGLTGIALVIYLIISEGSRLYPPRNLVPVL